ncbi:glycosyltransferase [uncultured Microbulbifer sp.]|uniref:glycosyltransferase n=1 Tax=uncultured Microbulbifer sp. TaxID=348147 RepID=UPI002630E100|nr:glycosyltransferase [uncultured Microbulbifer sp.]
MLKGNLVKFRRWINDSGADTYQHVGKRQSIVRYQGSNSDSGVAEDPTTFVKQLARDRSDLGESYIREILLDSEAYYHANPDVYASGMDAVDHYFTYGVKEGRKYFPVLRFRESRDFYISTGRKVFFSNAPSRDGSFKYRCLYQGQRYSGSLVYDGNTRIDKIVRAIFNCKVLIFSRPENIELTKFVICLAKNVGVQVEYDFDDLLLPEYSGALGHVRSKVSQAEPARQNAINKSALLPFADGFRCSTKVIAEHFLRLGKPTVVIPNKLPSSMLGDSSKPAERLSTISERKLKLIYLSGTATHKKDYSLINGVLIRLLQECPDKISLTFLGNTGVNIEPFKVYSSDVTVVGRVSFESMLDIISDHDLALVPLESTIFNDAKSNIKFIEAGSQGVPVVASRVAEFRSVIEHGVNGLLCKSQEEWLSVLMGVLNGSYDLEAMSYSARAKVAQEFVI